MKKSIQHTCIQNGKKYITVFQKDNESVCDGCAFNGKTECLQKIPTSQCLYSDNVDGLSRIWVEANLVIKQPALKVWVIEMSSRGRWITIGVELTREQARASDRNANENFKLKTRIRKYVPEIKGEKQ